MPEEMMTFESQKIVSKATARKDDDAQESVDSK